MSIKISLSIDTKGTRCPIPILRTKQGLKKVQEGEFIEVLATDPSTKKDMEAMLSHVPHRLVSYDVLSEGGIFVFVIQKLA